MANHASAIKRTRSSSTKRVLNRYQHKTARTFIKKLQQEHDPDQATQLYPKVCSLLDRLAKRNIIHPNKAARKKSQLARHINQLSSTSSAPSTEKVKKQSKPRSVSSSKGKKKSK